jgi:hypothetical protein
MTMKPRFPSAAVKRSTRALIHCVAACRECAWTCDEYMKAARSATRHVRETGHTVTVEQGIHYTVCVRKVQFTTACRP